MSHAAAALQPVNHIARFGDLVAVVESDEGYAYIYVPRLVSADRLAEQDDSYFEALAWIETYGASTGAGPFTTEQDPDCNVDIFDLHAEDEIVVTPIREL